MKAGVAEVDIAEQLPESGFEAECATLVGLALEAEEDTLGEALEVDNTAVDIAEADIAAAVDNPEEMVAESRSAAAGLDLAAFEPHCTLSPAAAAAAAVLNPEA